MCLGEGRCLPPSVWVGVPLGRVTPKGEAIRGHEGGAGSGLKFLGWPHARPSKDPFTKGNACEALGNGQ